MAPAASSSSTSSPGPNRGKRGSIQDLPKLCEFETRTRWQRIQRFIHKGMRRSKHVKVFFITMTLFQMFAFTAISLCLAWVRNGGDSIIANPFNWDKEDKYYSAIIDLGGLFSFLLGLSGVLRANTFEIISSLFAAMLASSRIFIVLAEGFRHSANPKRCASLISVLFVHLILLMISGVMVIKSFGWELYLKIGSHRHLRRAFQDFLLFATCMELDVIFVFYLAIAGAAFFFTPFEMALCWLCVLLDCGWSLASYVVLRREIYQKVFLYPFFFGCVLVPGYLIYKILDVCVLRTDKQANTPAASLVMSAVMALVLRIIVAVYGYRCWKNYGIGMRERLDEIGMTLGGQEAVERRTKYKREKAQGINHNQKKMKAMACFGALSGNVSAVSNQKTKPWSTKNEDERRKELKDVFEMFDSDGSGSIDAEELFVAMKTMGQRATMAEVEKMIADMDEDGNGDVDFDEFFVMMNKKLLEADLSRAQSQGAVAAFNAKSDNERQQEMRELFNKFDADGSGNIDAEEMYTALQDMGVNVTLDEVYDWVCEVDEDKSGTVDFDEFCTLLSKKLGNFGSKKTTTTTNNGMSKLEAIQAQLFASMQIAPSQQASPDAEYLTRLQQYDQQRLQLMKQGFPAEDTMLLAKHYKEIAELCKTDRTRKLASWWAKELVDRLLKQKDQKPVKREKAVVVQTTANSRKRGSIFSMGNRRESGSLLGLKAELEEREKKDAANTANGLTVDGSAGVC